MCNIKKEIKEITQDIRKRGKVVRPKGFKKMKPTAAINKATEGDIKMISKSKYFRGWEVISLE